MPCSLAHAATTLATAIATHAPTCTATTSARPWWPWPLIFQGGDIGTAAAETGTAITTAAGTAIAAAAVAASTAIAAAAVIANTATAVTACPTGTDGSNPTEDQLDVAYAFTVSRGNESGRAPGQTCQELSERVFSVLGWFVALPGGQHNSGQHTYLPTTDHPTKTTSSISTPVRRTLPKQHFA